MRISQCVHNFSHCYFITKTYHVLIFNYLHTTSVEITTSIIPSVTCCFLPKSHIFVLLHPLFRVCFYRPLPTQLSTQLSTQNQKHLFFTVFSCEILGIKKARNTTSFFICFVSYIALKLKLSGCFE